MNTKLKLYEIQIQKIRHMFTFDNYSFIMKAGSLNKKIAKYIFEILMTNTISEINSLHIMH